MSVTCGFYNSVNHDRTYDAEQVGRMFDGIINDGIYEGYGNALIVTASEGLTVSVGSGRCWFNHTWLYNDAELPLELEAAHSVFDRYDAVIVEVNTNEAVRETSLKIKTGNFSSNPQKPTMVKADGVYQYPLAYVFVEHAAISINGSNIENARGTEACPFVTGLLQVLSIDNLIYQWQSQLAETLIENQSVFARWMTSERASFEEWFSELQAILDPDVAANLAAAVLKLSRSMADIYSNSRAYAIGDYCMYQNQLYICIYPISSGENFNPSHWSAVTIATIADTKQNKLLKFVNTVAPTSIWQTMSPVPAGFEDYPVKGTLALTGVTADMVPEVDFSLPQLMNYSFPYVESYNGGIYIYTDEAPAVSLTIPTILIRT